MNENRLNVISYLLKLERAITKLYGNAYVDVINIAEVRKAIESGKDYSIMSSKSALKKVDEIISKLSTKVLALVKDGVIASYDKGTTDSNSTISKKVSGGDNISKLAAKKICEEVTKMHREDGITARSYASEKRGGMTLSNRIWSISDSVTKEIDIIIKNGISQGLSPADVSLSVQKYLKNPNMYGSSVLDKNTGQMVINKAALKYHPGVGVYRSSLANALRVARTEMTQAYRYAEWQSYQGNPLITSYEIRLSANHTTKKTVRGKTVIVQLTDICDKMVGIYPKSFKWGGWHPQCRCIMLPISITPEEFAKYVNDKNEIGKANAIKKMEEKASKVKLPKGYNEWIDANKDRINTAAKSNGRYKIPQWMQDNYPNGLPK